MRSSKREKEKEVSRRVDESAASLGVAGSGVAIGISAVLLEKSRALKIAAIEEVTEKVKIIARMQGTINLLINALKKINETPEMIEGAEQTKLVLKKLEDIAIQALKAAKTEVPVESAKIKLKIAEATVDIAGVILNTNILIITKRQVKLQMESLTSLTQQPNTIGIVQKAMAVVQEAMDKLQLVIDKAAENGTYALHCFCKEEGIKTALEANTLKTMVEKIITMIQVAEEAAKTIKKVLEAAEIAARAVNVAQEAVKKSENLKKRAEKLRDDAVKSSQELEAVRKEAEKERDKLEAVRKEEEKKKQKTRREESADKFWQKLSIIQARVKIAQMKEEAAVNAAARAQQEAEEALVAARKAVGEAEEAIRKVAISKLAAVVKEVDVAVDEVQVAKRAAGKSKVVVKKAKPAEESALATSTAKKPEVGLAIAL